MIFEEISSFLPEAKQFASRLYGSKRVLTRNERVDIWWYQLDLFQQIFRRVIARPSLSLCVFALRLQACSVDGSTTDNDVRR